MINIILLWQRIARPIGNIGTGNMGAAILFILFIVGLYFLTRKE